MTDIAQQAHEIQAVITQRTITLINTLDALMPLVDVPITHERARTLDTLGKPATPLAAVPQGLMLVHSYGRHRIAVITRADDKLRGVFLTSNALNTAHQGWLRSQQTSAENLPWPLHPDFVRRSADLAHEQASLKLEHYRTSVATPVQDLIDNRVEHLGHRLPPGDGFELARQQIAIEVSTWLDHARQWLERHDDTYPARAYQDEIVRTSVIRAVARHREQNQPWAATAILRDCTTRWEHGVLLSPGTLREAGLLPATTLRETR